MDSEVKIYIERAENELILARVNFDISTKNELKKLHGIPIGRTFFNDVISEAYYVIFYAAKAYLFSKGIKTSPPEEHKKTYEEFARFANSNKLSNELLAIYDLETEKAAVLLRAFSLEKRKRGNFIYNVKSEANIPFALESLNNAKKFIIAIRAILKDIEN